MDSTPSQRRLQAIHGHLTTAAADSESPLRPNLTAGEFVSGVPSLSLSHTLCFQLNFGSFLIA